MSWFTNLANSAISLVESVDRGSGVVGEDEEDADYVGTREESPGGGEKQQQQRGALPGRLTYEDEEDGGAVEEGEGGEGQHVAGSRRAKAAALARSGFSLLSSSFASASALVKSAAAPGGASKVMEGLTQVAKSIAHTAIDTEDGEVYEGDERQGGEGWGSEEEQEEQEEQAPVVEGDGWEEVRAGAIVDAELEGELLSGGAAAAHRPAPAAAAAAGEEGASQMTDVPLDGSASREKTAVQLPKMGPVPGSSKLASSASGGGGGGGAGGGIGSQKPPAAAAGKGRGKKPAASATSTTSSSSTPAGSALQPSAEEVRRLRKELEAAQALASDERSRAESMRVYAITLDKKIALLSGEREEAESAHHAALRSADNRHAETQGEVTRLGHELAEERSAREDLESRVMALKVQLTVDRDRYAAALEEKSRAGSSGSGSINGSASGGGGRAGKGRGSGGCSGGPGEGGKAAGRGGKGGVRGPGQPGERAAG